MTPRDQWSQMLGEDSPPVPRTFPSTDLSAHELPLSRSDRYVHDEPLHSAVTPEEVLAVFQPWQYKPLSERHRGVDVRPKVPD